MTLAKHPPRIGVFWINILDIPLIKMLHPLFVQTSRKSPTSFAGNDNFYIVVIVYITMFIIVVITLIVVVFVNVITIVTVVIVIVMTMVASS